MAKSTILIVDDEPEIFALSLRILKNQEYNILTAESGKEGLYILKKNKVHLVISDMRMEEMDGIEFLKRVKLEYPDIITIMATGFADIDAAVKAINEAGVYKFILKPWDAEYLKLTIKRALDLRDLVMERDILMEHIKSKEALYKEIEERHPGITKIKRNRYGEVVLKITDDD